MSSHFLVEKPDPPPRRERERTRRAFFVGERDARRRRRRGGGGGGGRASSTAGENNAENDKIGCDHPENVLFDDSFLGRRRRRYRRRGNHHHGGRGRRDDDDDDDDDEREHPGEEEDSHAPSGAPPGRAPTQKVEPRMSRGVRTSISTGVGPRGSDEEHRERRHVDRGRRDGTSGRAYRRREEN